MFNPASIGDVQTSNLRSTYVLSWLLKVLLALGPASARCQFPIEREDLELIDNRKSVSVHLSNKYIQSYMGECWN
ncbi:hypothetical protein BC939DRAFT_85588 [Gamsiella multidivaricata]|uniref:uncharacterized protein n=1 Tax=Gamsiella multidivaricata TaxID=101098 RepID=UPI00221F15B6|nr:uncharacterized protein BC939DRAFT_85588 [Gamsiella multidivaricata]KAI7827629.1 hypothetical protein BC939DRAFT_85588 [Gamsiella multidivaricata]